MKTFNTTLIVPLFITLVLTGCMPDSLTKFKKDPPKKPVVTTPVGSGPVVDETGAPVPFDQATYWGYGSPDNESQYAEVGQSFNPKKYIDGSLGDSIKAPKFFERCDLMTTGVNSQASSLPAGISFNSADCKMVGAATSAKSITSPFCSDAFSTDKVTCESTPLSWNASTGTCSLPDVQYATQSACLAGAHKWYAVGQPIPYRIRMTYHDSTGLQKYYYTTLTVGVYTKLTSLGYTQSERILLSVTASGTYLKDIVPVITTSASAGAYARANVMINNRGDVAGIAKFVDETVKYVGVARLVPIKLNSVTPFTINTFIESITGICTAGAFTSKPSCITGGGTWTPSKIAKIYKIDTTTRTLYVENISTANRYFLKNESICTGTCGTTYTIASIDDSYLFKKSDLIDNDKQFFTGRFTLQTPINVFEVGAQINPLLPVASSSISANNGITFSISPALPCEDPTDITKCLYLDTNTGSISGTFSASLNNTEFTLTASNPISSISSVINLSAIYGPSNLSMTTKQIITVSSTAAFKEGETLFQPIQAPGTAADALRARIIKVINSKQLAIETFNGIFNPGVSLDNNNSAYQSEKAFIIPYSTCTNTIYTTKATCIAGGEVWSPSDAVHFNVMVTTASTPSGYAEGDSISSTAGVGVGALGRVAYISVSGGRDTLYVQYLTGTALTTLSAKTFNEDDILNTGVSVYQIENSAMKVLLSSVTGFTKGSDVVTSALSSGYTSEVSGAYLSISDISRASGGIFFKKGQTFYNHETQALQTNTAVAAAVTFENYLIFERGKKMFINTLLSNGNGILYSISPPLPSGLVLNTTNGSISGTATSSSIKKDYVLYATNFIGTTSFAFSLEVKDFFEVIEKTGASSALLHKVGDYQNNRKCRIDATDIALLTNGKSLDIRCFLDMEEQDIFETNIKLNLFTGPSICQYIEYSPYYFNSWSPHSSAGSSSRYTNPITLRSGCTALDSTGPAPTVDLCESNYSYYNTAYPNCDEGYLTYYDETYTQDTTTGTCTRTSTIQKRLNCGGARANCIAGPVTDVIDKTNLALGKRVIIYPSAAGINKENEHKAPIRFGDNYINVRTANGSIANQCNSSAANTLNWKNATTATSLLASPLSYDSNPYYTVTCLDAAYDIKARIRIIVRDWDKTFRIDSDIFNQSVTVPATNMNNNNPDPIFNKPYNDVDDWDDSYAGSPPVYSSCGTQAAGSCTPIAGLFRSNAQCAGAGGSVGVAGSCSAGGFTDEYSCESSGTCSDVTKTDPGSCAKVPATWTFRTWTPPTCLFTNQNQCTHYGGTWTGPEYYKFPESLLGK